MARPARLVAIIEWKRVPLARRISRVLSLTSWGRHFAGIEACMCGCGPRAAMASSPVWLKIKKRRLPQKVAR